MKKALGALALLILVLGIGACGQERPPVPLRPTQSFLNLNFHNESKITSTTRFGNESLKSCRIIPAGNVDITEDTIEMSFEHVAGGRRETVGFYFPVKGAESHNDDRSGIRRGDFSLHYQDTVDASATRGFNSWIKGGPGRPQCLLTHVSTKDRVVRGNFACKLYGGRSQDISETLDVAGDFQCTLLRARTQ